TVARRLTVPTAGRASLRLWLRTFWKPLSEYLTSRLREAKFCWPQSRPSTHYLMLTFLNISNIALIDELTVEFDRGLNLLTGETGSGKSIIVDALGVLIGARFPSDLLKTGRDRGFIEGLFSVDRNPDLEQLLIGAGIEADRTNGTEIIIRRELAANGRNKIFINHQLATQTLLRELRPFLVDIHGQGDQQTLFDATTHMQLLDSFARTDSLREEVTACHRRWALLRRELEAYGKEDAEKFQLI